MPEPKFCPFLTTPFLTIQGMLNPQPAGMLNPTGLKAEMKTAPCLKEKCALWVSNNRRGDLYAPDDDGNCAIRLLGYAAGRLPLSIANNLPSAEELPTIDNKSLRQIADALTEITTTGLKVQRKE